MNKAYILVLIIGLVSMSGCCSIFHGGSQQLTFNSVPPGVLVQVGPYNGVTPFTLKVPKGKNLRITAEHNNIEINKIVTKKIDNVVWLNYWTVFIGFLVDWPTGNMYLYEPVTYNFDFTQK